VPATLSDRVAAPWFDGPMSDRKAAVLNRLLRGARVEGSTEQTRFAGVFLGVLWDGQRLELRDMRSQRGDIIISIGPASRLVIRQHEKVEFEFIGPPRERCARCRGWVELESLRFSENGTCEHAHGCPKC